MPQITQRILREEVLDKTMHLFWKKGFFNTSIDDIVAVTGFHRAAIYKHFGGKEELFLAMLKRYRNQLTPQLTAPLYHPPLGLDSIKTFFTQFVHLYHQNGLSNGCFLIATASDLPSHSDEVALFIKDFLEQLRQLFSNILNNSKINNELKLDVNINSTADFLVGNVFGLMTLFRAQAKSEIVENHINGTIHFLSIISEAPS